MTFEEAMARFGGERWRKEERLKVARLKAEEKAATSNLDSLTPIAVACVL
jgi:hypothetical protein